MKHTTFSPTPLLVFLLPLVWASNTYGLSCIDGGGNSWPDFSTLVATLCSGEQQGVWSTSAGDAGDGGVAYSVECALIQEGPPPSPSGNNAVLTCTYSDLYVDANSIESNDQDAGNTDAASCNPINLITGNKYKIHTDISNTDGNDSLMRPEFVRTYNSLRDRTGPQVIGHNWTHNYQRSIKLKEPLNTGENVSIISAGGNSDPLQSSVYNTPEATLSATGSAACLNGFNDLVNNYNAGLIGDEFKKIAAGTAVWSGSECEVHSGGKYLATLPLRAHTADYTGSFVVPDFFNEARIIRPDGKEYVFTKDPSYQILSTQEAWNSQTPQSTASLLQTSIDGAIENYIFTDENDIKETYDSTLR